jgi:hypothetical protein
MLSVISAMKVYRNERNKIKKRANQVGKKLQPKPKLILKAFFAPTPHFSKL